MTMHDEIETRIRRALAVTPSAEDLRYLDERVGRAMAQPSAIRRGFLPQRRVFVRPLALVAAFIILAGTAAAAIGLLERTAISTPGFRAAWDRAQVLGIVQTDAGYTLTLERAYADLNQVAVFVSLEGLALPRSTDGVQTDHLSVWEATLRDPTGRMPVLTSGTDAADGGLGAALRSFQFDGPAAEAGTYELTIKSFGYGADGPTCVKPCVNDRIEGTWQFAFDLPKPTGTVVSTDATATVGQATLSVTELRISPTMVSARIAMHVDGKPVASWSFIPSDDDLRHDGVTYGFWTTRHILDVAPFEEGPEMELYTSAGVDKPTGTWEIVIPELDYQMDGVDEPVHLAGPWTLTVTVP
jgi:hypothetical protein